jgi:SAM-dependent methyltransferase
MQIEFQQPGNHLDLGCGTNPKNPYGQTNLFGIDIRDDTQEFLKQKNITVAKANLALEKIPFQDNFFSSISAFDFLEHIPRQIYMDKDREIIYPFVILMNEIWRVLTLGGKFLAITPAYPSESAFVDPTHVNFITKDTHKYFCGKQPGARMYGFQGEFIARTVKFSAPSNYQSMPPDVLRSKVRDLLRKFSRTGFQYLVWEFEAVK